MMNYAQLKSWNEWKYWVSRWFARHGQSVLFKVMPKWLVTQALLRASRHIKGHEIVPNVRFMDILERQMKSR